MPTTTSKPFVISIATNTPEWKLVNALRSNFVTLVNDKDGKPKMTKDNVQQTRKASGDEIVGRILTSVFLHASVDTLSALADEAVDKKGSDGKEPKYKTKEFIESISKARDQLAPPKPRKEVEEMSEEELAELERRIQRAKSKHQEAVKPTKGTKDVAPV